jgi:hypothetical protein
MNPPAGSELSKRKTSQICLDDEKTVESSNKRPKVVIDLTSPLCVACQELNIEAKFKIAHKRYQQVSNGSRSFPDSIYEAKDGTWYYEDAIVAHRFGESLSKPTDCSLCGFFQSLRVEPDRYKSHKLLAFRGSDSWLYRADWLHHGNDPNQFKTFKDSIFMAVVPDLKSIPDCGYAETWLDLEIPSVGAIYCLQPHESQKAEDDYILRARELDDEPNLVGVRGWLNLCRKIHGSCCEKRTSDEPITRGFRLIDCRKKPPVVEGKPYGTTYAALSYVWGSKPEDLIDLPETVLDAIEVTERLGLQYLWVDRLCINQKDQDEKAYLISRMNTIYEEAEFTIVAAAGAGASHGLPGIRSKPRTPQPKYYLETGSVLLSMLQDPRRDILKSNYWTRGWTYQEGVLSNRRIVFTEEQVYWECRSMAAQESIDSTLFHISATKEEDNPEGVMADWMLAGIFKTEAYNGGSRDADIDVVPQDEDHHMNYGFPTQRKMSVRAQLRGLNEHIREFSKRKLTRDADTLLALQGIFGLYARTKEIYVLHGLPMWIDKIAGCYPGAQYTFALSVSSWYHRKSSNQYMYVSEPCRRNSHLPSWTWAGWIGTVSWRAPPIQEHCAYMTDLIEAKSHKLLWAADISLHGADVSRPIYLQDTFSASRLAVEAPTSIKIKDPIMLNEYRRVEQTEKEWKWGEPLGRPGRQQNKAKQPSWDAKWYRIGRRLSCTGMSVAMTQYDWTAKHISGELISVLMFAGKFLHNEHGTARFLTLKKVSSSGSGPEYWERVGTLYLTIPFNDKCSSVQDFLKKIPAARSYRKIEIR